MTTTAPEAISQHAQAADAKARRGFGPRVRRLHTRIGAAHRQAEGMVFSKALLAGQASPLQIAALMRALQPGYELIETAGPAIARQLGCEVFPWGGLGRSASLQRDVAQLQGLPATPTTPGTTAWLEQLQELADQHPHRFMAHVYVRYGGDLSGGQQLGEQANAILGQAQLPEVSFWQFEQPTVELKEALHEAFEQLQLSPEQEEELLDEAEAGFRATQRLLAELAEVTEQGELTERAEMGS